MKNEEKGITLIALIITIIVMLILVGVTINVALNGGLFPKAQTASTQTQRELEREQLISAMVGAYDNNGRFDKDLVGTLPSRAKWCKEDETYENATNDPDECDWIVTENNNKFYIDSNGSVLDEPNVENNILVGEKFYSPFYQGSHFYEIKYIEVLSNTKALLVTNPGTDPVQYMQVDYTYENNLVLGVWPVYVINNNNINNIVMVAESGEEPGLYNVMTNNKGANVTPLSGKTFKKNGSEKTMNFFNNHDYGFVNISTENSPVYYALIDDGNVCKLYINGSEWNVTKTNGEYTSFSRGTETYELYTPEEP